jgi:hypothetical protein
VLSPCPTDPLILPEQYPSFPPKEIASDHIILGKGTARCNERYARNATSGK